MTVSGRPGSALRRAFLPFAVALCAGLLFSASWPPPPVHDDAAEYLSLARNVAAGRGFTQDGLSPESYRPPLFSFLLGGWFRLAGTSSVGSAAVFQSLVLAGGAAAAYLLFLEFLPAGWALGGALFLALHPLLFTRVAFVLQEPTLLLATTVAALATVRLLRDPSPGRAAAAGLAWGFCILAKSVALFAPPLVALARWFPLPSLRVRLPRRETALLLLVAGLVVAPWTVRNALRFGRLIPVNDQGGGMLAYNVVQTTVEGDPERERLVDAIRRGGARAEGTRERAWRFVLRHPREFLLERTVRNAARFAVPPRDWWFAPGRALPGSSTWLLRVLAYLSWVPPFGALAVATWSAARGRAAPDPGIRFLLLFCWGYWAQHALVWGDPRFGVAIFPALLAIGLSHASGNRPG